MQLQLLFGQFARDIVRIDREQDVTGRHALPGPGADAAHAHPFKRENSDFPLRFKRPVGFDGMLYRAGLRMLCRYNGDRERISGA